MLRFVFIYKGYKKYWFKRITKYLMDNLRWGWLVTYWWIELDNFLIEL